MDVSSRDLLIGYSLLPFLNPHRAAILLQHFEPLSSARNASAAMLSAMLNIPSELAVHVKDPLQIPEIRALVASLRDHAITLEDSDYPPLLREIYDPPLALFTRGNTGLLRSPSIAIVGSRKASAYGVSAAESIARSLAGAGVTIVSGMARGIDAAAHRAALAAGGSTVAVLGTGIDVAYPRSHRSLLEEIALAGLAVTEFAPATPPRASNFPVRNRIISGLAYGTVIVEATGRSGSLITARMAAEQGREVFAVPGPIFSAGTEGPHRLIQYGAKLLHRIDDVFDEIRQLEHLRPSPNAPLETLDAILGETLAAFEYHEGVSVDRAAEKLGTGVAALAERLLALEMKGLLRSLPGARYIRIAP